MHHKAEFPEIRLTDISRIVGLFLIPIFRNVYTFYFVGIKLEIESKHNLIQSKIEEY